jgi:hypothetical protein
VFVNLQLPQRFSRVERVTGIEPARQLLRAGSAGIWSRKGSQQIKPALSAWELSDHVAAVLGVSFAVLSGLECPLDACRDGTLVVRNRVSRSSPWANFQRVIGSRRLGFC